MNLYHTTIPQLSKMLKNLSGWLDRATEHAAAKSFDPAVLVASRLAPDQYPLLRQIQVACDHAKFIASRLAGRTPPSHPDTEQTIDELRARIQTVLEYLDTVTPADFEGAESRVITLSFLKGKVLSGADYLTEIALPNFYFHIGTAYSILRHNGVNLGKRDFLGPVNNLRDAE